VRRGVFACGICVGRGRSWPRRQGFSRSLVCGSSRAGQSASRSADSSPDAGSFCLSGAIVKRAATRAGAPARRSGFATRLRPPRATHAAYPAGAVPARFRLAPPSGLAPVRRRVGAPRPAPWRVRLGEVEHAPVVRRAPYPGGLRRGRGRHEGRSAAHAPARARGGAVAASVAPLDARRLRSLEPARARQP
jgi:hypothetical protein